MTFIDRSRNSKLRTLSCTGDGRVAALRIGRGGRSAHPHSVGGVADHYPNWANNLGNDPEEALLLFQFPTFNEHRSDMEWRKRQLMQNA